MKRAPKADLGLRVYSTLLRMYPREFRDRFGFELLEGFRGRRERLAQGPGYIKGLRLWGWALLDLLLSVPREHAAMFRRGPHGKPVDPGAREPGTGRGGHGSSMDDLLLDVRFASRLLLRRPLFTVVAIGTMGLGIGAATAVSSIVKGVLLEDLPYPEPHRLVNVWKTRPERRNLDVGGSWWDRIQLTHPEYLRWRDGTSQFEAVALYRGGDG